MADRNLANRFWHCCPLTRSMSILPTSILLSQLWRDTICSWCTTKSHVRLRRCHREFRVTPLYHPRHWRPLSAIWYAGSSILTSRWCQGYIDLWGSRLSMSLDCRYRNGKRLWLEESERFSRCWVWRAPRDLASRRSCETVWSIVFFKDIWRGSCGLGLCSWGCLQYLSASNVWKGYRVRRVRCWTRLSH